MLNRWNITHLGGRTSVITMSDNESDDDDMRRVMGVRVGMKEDPYLVKVL